MAYCAIEDLESLMQLDFTATSQPNQTQVQDWIDNVAAEIDGVAEAAGYTLPVTAASALKLLKQYNEYGAGVPTWHAAFRSDDEPPHVAFWREAYENFIARLRRGEQNLPGEEADAEQDIAFDIAPALPRDRYWLTGEEV